MMICGLPVSETKRDAKYESWRSCMLQYAHPRLASCRLVSWNYCDGCNVKVIDNDLKWSPLTNEWLCASSTCHPDFYNPNHPTARDFRAEKVYFYFRDAGELDPKTNRLPGWSADKMPWRTQRRKINNNE